MPSYNLAERAWIPVQTTDGTGQELSLKQVITGAHQLARITGNPLEAAVLFRLLLAIAHQVCELEDRDSWLEVWQNQEPLQNRMAAYVAEHHDKFDLYGRPRPFAQHPGLPEPNRTPAEIVYDRAQGNNPVFLDASIVAEANPIPSALAARSLLVTHAYGGSGTGGNNPLNGGKKDTMFAGPLCARMIAILEGENLLESIILNLAYGRKAGKPAWERPLSEIPGLTKPTGLSDLYTRTTRNALLAPSEDGEFCVGVAVRMGQGLDSAEDGSDDPLIPVYYVSKDKVFKALRQSTEKALWRNSEDLLVPAAAADTRPLASIANINNLISSDDLGKKGRMRLRTLGIAANAQGPVSELWRDEALPFHLSLFQTGNGYAQLSRAMQMAEFAADQFRRRLYIFATEYVCNGGSAPDPKDVKRLQDELSPGLQDFWMKIGPQGEQLALAPPNEVEWEKTCLDASNAAYKDAINRLAPDARRYRAEFARSGNPSEKSKKKGTATV